MNSALVATYIWSKTTNTTLDEAKKQIYNAAQNYHNGDLEVCCWYISFGSSIEVPYQQTIEEVLAPILGKYSATLATANKLE